MPAIVEATVEEYLAAGQNGQTTTEQGRALEDLICYVFGLVPGVEITHRNELNAFETEEIDVALWNNGAADGFGFLPNIVLIECKNWSSRVGSNEVNWFDTKLRNRGLTFGILVSPLGITGQAADLTAAHLVVANALREGRRLLIIRTEELRTIGDTVALIKLIKLRLCDLAVKGTVG
jgi:hypothetical protein